MPSRQFFPATLVLFAKEEFRVIFHHGSRKTCPGLQMKLASLCLLQGASLTISLALVVLQPEAALERSISFLQQQLPEKPAEIGPGLVVERVGKGAEAERAGIVPGDLLLTWTRGNDNGRFTSPFDLTMIEIEQGPRGKVSIEGMRNGKDVTWILGLDAWDMDARPNFSGTQLSGYQDGLNAARSGKPAEAAEKWHALTQTANGANWLRPWLLASGAKSWAQNKQWKEADQQFQAAIESASTSGPFVRMQLFRDWSATFVDRRDLASADKYYQQALLASRELGHETLCAAVNLNSLTVIASRRGDITRSDEYGTEALLLREQLAPESLTVARTLRILGVNAFYKGDLSRADELWQRSLQIIDKLSPGGSESAAITINLAAVSRNRGDLIAAEDYYRHAWEIEQKLFPGGPGVAVSLGGLGNVALDRGDLVGANSYFLQSLRVVENLAPNSIDVAGAYLRLGLVRTAAAEFAEAEDYYQKALDLQEKAAPGSIVVATTLSSLGDLAWNRKDFEKAEELQRKALQIIQKISPGKLDAAHVMGRLGDLAQNKGEITAAEDYYRRSLAIREELCPGSAWHAESLGALAGVLRLQGKIEEASEMFQRSINALERQTTRLGGSDDARTSFRARHSSIYRDYVELLLASGKTQLAFEVLERSRARTLLETLARGHVDVHGGVDPTLLRREHSLSESLTARQDRRIRMLSENHSAEQVAALDKEIENIVNEYQEVRAQLQKASPNYSALTEPRTLDAKEIQQQLDGNTLLLEYMLGEKTSYVFAITRDLLSVYRLPARSTIEEQVRRVYDLGSAHGRRRKNEADSKVQARWLAAEREFPIAAAELSHMILAPVAAELKDRRLLIVGDGPIAYVPFASLSEPGSSRYAPLAIQHEVVGLPAASMLTILRETEKSRPKPPLSVAVLADPVFDQTDARVKGQNPGRVGLPSQPSPGAGGLSVALMTRSAMDIGLGAKDTLHFARLPFSRQEAETILQMVASSQGMRALDFQASRQMATNSRLADYRIVHFATHGFLDSVHPELSGLVFSLVNRQGQPQSGFLSLEDTYNLSLPVDLVVLSGCETGLGKEIDGEGLSGLMRGFMYAGASRVVASLWRVDDAATAELMKHFYSAMLHDRIPPGAALRKAQLIMRAQRRWANPYYWSGFTIQGEWRGWK